MGEAGSGGGSAPDGGQQHLRDVHDLDALGAEPAACWDVRAVLGLAPQTLNRAMMKIGARDRAQLVVAAFQSGLVRPGDPGAPAAS